MVATASTAGKLALARERGADHTVVFPSTTTLDELRSLLPQGADVVFDPIGGDAFDLSLRCIANSGRILVIGFTGGRIQQIPANTLLVKDVTVLGFNFGNYVGWGRTDERQRMSLLCAPRWRRFLHSISGEKSGRSHRIDFLCANTGPRWTRC